MAANNKKHTYKSVLFDMDGVLIDSLELWITVGLEGFKELKLDTCTREDMIKAIVKFETISKLGITDLLGFGKRINELFAERVLEIQLQKNILSTLQALQKKNIKMGVVTTSGRVAVDKILHNLEIAHFFDVVVTYDDVTNFKPHPESLFKALSHMNTAPEHSIMVGDTRNDILAGKRAGTTTVMFYPDWHEAIYNRDHLLGLCADYYIRDLEELNELI